MRRYRAGVIPSPANQPRKRCRSGKVLPPPLNADTDGSPSPADRRGSAARSSQTRVRPTRLRATLRAVHSESRQVAAEALTVLRSATATQPDQDQGPTAIASDQERARAIREARQRARKHDCSHPIPPGFRGAIYEPIQTQSRIATSCGLSSRQRRNYCAASDADTRTPEADRRLRRWRTLQRDAADTARINRQTFPRRVLTRREREADRHKPLRPYSRRSGREKQTRLRDAGNGSKSARGGHVRLRRRGQQHERGDGQRPLRQYKDRRRRKGRKPTEEDFNWQPTYY